MKRLTVLMLFVFSIVSMPATAQSVIKRYQIKSGKAKYVSKSTGGMGIQSGEESVVWDNFGKNERRDSTYNIKVMGMNQTHKSTVITDGEWAYSYDDKTDKITKIKYSEFFNSKGRKGKNPGKIFSEKSIEEFGGEKIGQKTVLGRKCTNYRMADYGTEVCLYKGVALLTVMNYMGMNNTIEAVEFEENARVAVASFDIPQNGEVVDATDMLQQYRNLTNTAEMQEAREAMKNLQAKQVQQIQQIRQENKTQPEDYQAGVNNELGSIQKLNENLEGSSKNKAQEAVSKALSIFGKRNK